MHSIITYISHFRCMFQHKHNVQHTVHVSQSLLYIYDQYYTLYCHLIFFWGGGGAAQSLSYPRVPVTFATPLSIKIRRENGVNCFGAPLKKLCEENHNHKFFTI